MRSIYINTRNVEVKKKKKKKKRKKEKKVEGKFGNDFSKPIFLLSIISKYYNGE